jgi:hypothetical protein
MRRLYAVFAGAFALYVLVVAGAHAMRAQAQSSRESALERRVETVEKWGERLARLETLVEGLKEQSETNNKLLLGACASLFGLIAERAVRGGASRMRRPAQAQAFKVAEE